jgi:hypothetical protein
MTELSGKPKEVVASEKAREFSGTIADLEKRIHDTYRMENKPESVSIRDAYGDSIANVIDDLVEGPGKEIQDLWEKYKDAVLVEDPDFNGFGAHYNPDSGAVTINIDDSRRGDWFEPPYQTAFHEFGHNIDFRINEKINGDVSKAYSETYKDGLLGKTAKDEAAAYIEKNRLQMEQETGRSVSAEEVCEKINEELMEKIPLIERADLSDIFEGATDGKISLGAGHGKEYWETHNNGTEIFAEIFSASICNKGSLNAIKEYFPETYKFFQEIVRSSNEQA